MLHLHSGLAEPEPISFERGGPSGETTDDDPLFPLTAERSPSPPPAAVHQQVKGPALPAPRLGGQEHLQSNTAPVAVTGKGKRKAAGATAGQAASKRKRNSAAATAATEQPASTDSPVETVAVTLDGKDTTALLQSLGGKGPRAALEPLQTQVNEVSTSSTLSPLPSGGSDALSISSHLPPGSGLPGLTADEQTQTQQPKRKINKVIYAGFEIYSEWPSPYPEEAAILGQPAAGGSNGKDSDLERSTSGRFSKKSSASTAASTSASAGGSGAGKGKAAQNSQLETVKADKPASRAASPAPSHGGASEEMTTTDRLYVCEGCFKYMIQGNAYAAHRKNCEYKTPPGRKVYQRGAHTIWEVDGAEAKLYCQNLCLFGKLFIGTKYVFFDVEGFMFYLLTEGVSTYDYVLGFFSKEKVSYDDYNLACIVTFPPFQRKGYGSLLIEFSYELDRRRGTAPGTPERPLSSMGLKGYLNYWTGTLARYLQSILTHRGYPPEWPYAGAAGGIDEVDDKKKRRISKGWQGEVPVAPRAGGSRRSDSHLLPAPATAASAAPMEKFDFATSLVDIARATHIRPEDAAHALVVSGLAQFRRLGRMVDEDGNQQEMGQLIVTPDLIEKVLKERKIKDPVLGRQFVRL